MDARHADPPDLATFLADPLGTLASGRRDGWYWPSGMGLPGMTLLHYEDVRTILRDDRFQADFTEMLRAMGIGSGSFYEWMAKSPLDKHGDELRSWRQLVTRTFTPRSVEHLRPFLQRSAGELTDSFVTDGSCEFVGQFADVYPSLGLCELIGVPLSDRDWFRSWANTIGLGFNMLTVAQNIAAIDAALDDLLEYTTRLVALRREDPHDDLVTRLAHTAAAEDAPYSDEQVTGAVAGLVFAGHETTRNQLGWMVLMLADHPEVWDGLAVDDSDLGAVVEEVLRLRSAVTMVSRTASETVEHRGLTIEAGTRLFFSLTSADQDEGVFATPESFDPAANRGAAHVAFGFGAHHCIGAALARAELQESLRVLTKRISCPVIGEGVGMRDFDFIGITGPDRLPITFTPRPTWQRLASL